VQRHIIDPTRLDAVQPHDPLAQTTLYVVASLAEPGVSALLWPLLAELAAALGHKTVVHIVALLATGSFAQDDTQVLEEAAAYAALTELEALTGIAGRAPQVHRLLHEAVGSAGSTGWEQRVGARLFDRIYLLDREKSNQALARDSLELAVLASNAIEAFLVADGAAYIETQLGPDMHGPGGLTGAYSLLGAASDYVPLAQYILAAVQEERRRIVRDEVLTSPSPPPQDSLHDLALAPADVVDRLRTSRTRSIFEPASLQPASRQRGTGSFWRAAVGWLRPGQREAEQRLERLPELRVARGYVFPAAVARKLDSADSLVEWRALAEAQIRQVDSRIQRDIESRQFEQEWGLTYNEPTYHDNELARALAWYAERTLTARYQNDRRTLPAALLTALHTTLDDICSAPNGILTARARLNGWIEQVDVLLSQQHQQETRAERRSFSADEVQQARLAWEQEFIRVAGASPRQPAIIIRSVMLWLFIGYLLFAWFNVELAVPQRPFFAGLFAGTALRPDVVLLLVVLIFCGALALTVGWLVAALDSDQRSRIKEQRVSLIQRALSQRANRIVRQNLYRVYDQARADLRYLRGGLDSAIEELSSEAGTSTAPITHPPEPITSLTAAGSEGVHLYRAHTRPELWQAIKHLVQQEQMSASQTSQELFHALWTQEGAQRDDWQAQGEHLAQRVRLWLELPFNERDLPHVLLLEARQRRLQELLRAQRALVPETYEQAIRGLHYQLEQDMQAGAWCAYAAGPPNQQPAPRCTACLDARHGCPFSSAGREQRMVWSLAAIVRGYIDRATRHLVADQQGRLHNHAFVRHIFEHYSLEQVLFSVEHASATNGAQDARFAFLEDIYARAKPSASYDLSGALAYPVLEVDFVVTDRASTSELRSACSQRAMALLSSYDPITISAVRTVNGLRLKDLALTARCATAYMRLEPENRDSIALLPTRSQNEVLYGTASTAQPTYEKISL
jgi:hypothetical protein